MRLPATKVYRAFPELDRFSEEQCQRFLKAAGRGKLRWLLHFSAKVLGAGLVFVAVGAAMLGIGRLIGGRTSIEPIFFSDWLSVLVLAVEFGATGLAWLFVKDRLLRRRIRQVINSRGSCPGCGYSLTGLPVGPESKVVCPECGFGLATEADFGEVVITEGGVRRFMPSPDVVPPLLRWLTPRRRKWAVRLGVGVPVAVVLLLVLGWGGYEWFLRRQAAAAQAARVGVEGVVEHLLKHQPEDGPEGSPDAWAYFVDAESVVSQIDGGTWQARTSADPSAPYPDFSEIYAVRDASEDSRSAEDVARSEAAGELARALIEDYRAAGVFGAFEKMSACRRAVRPISPPAPGQPLVEILLPELGRARNMARINAARMKLGADSGDVAEFVSALEANLAMVRMLRHGMCLIDRLVGVSIETMTFERVRAALAVQRPREWIEAMRGAVERQQDGLGFEVTMEGERIVALDTVSWVFADPSRVRAGRFSKNAMGLWSGQGDLDAPLGTYASNLRRFDAVFEDVTVRLKAEPWQRAAPRPPLEPMRLDVFIPKDNAVFMAADRERVQGRGIGLLLALEMFRCETGGYPLSLTELVPKHLGVMPLDPWTGKPFGYRRIEGSEYGRPVYVLYSAGLDGIDDGGAEGPEGKQWSPWPGMNRGLDLVISPPWIAEEKPR